MSWKEMIEEKREQLVGRKVEYEGEIYTITQVDMNGSILIDKQAEHTPDTAVYMYYDVMKHLVEDK